MSDEQHLVKDQNGNPLEVIGSWSEVTARKTAEQAALAQSEQRLTDAIETISEGFSLYDNQDRLVLGNAKYAELFDHGEGPPKTGTTFEEIMRSAAAHGLIQDARAREEGWLRQRLAAHRHPGEPLLERHSDGRWLQISERRTETGGTVAVYSDLTDVKESEQRAAAANQLILQSLRYASRIQSAVLPARRELDTIAADHFLIWEPRDIVGGDFFWFQPINDGYAVMVGDCDGLIDQIGGPRGRSFGKRRFQELLKKNLGTPMAEQEDSFRKALATYQGQQIRRDDLTVLGFVPHA